METFRPKDLQNSYYGHGQQKKRELYYHYAIYNFVVQVKDFSDKKF